MTTESMKVGAVPSTGRAWRRRSLAMLAIVGLLAIAYLLFWPVALEPHAWTPPPAPALEGPYESNSRLAATELLAEGFGPAPEDVALDAEGRIYGGYEDGRIVRLQPDGSRPEVFADTEGRPVGMRFDAAGNLIVCDCARGLLEIGPDGAIRVLATEAEGVPFRLTDDLDVAADGTIYFTDASSKYTFPDFNYDLLEHGPNGRLLAYDPASGETRVLIEGLRFANGVAVAPDQSSLLVVETGRYRIHRYWLAGERAGTTEIFAENLPGFPDGVMSNGRGVYWVAIPSPRDATLDALLPYPVLRSVLARLPRALLPTAQPYGFVLGLDEQGRVVANLQDPSGERYANISNAVEHGGYLYLGSLTEHAIGRVPLAR